MSSAEVYIVVEGQTEQTFVREILAPEMGRKGVFLYPALIGKPGHKGGDIRFERAKVDIGNFLKQRRDTFVSTMFDYFRLEMEWPGRAGARSNSLAVDKGQQIESAMLETMRHLLCEQDVERRFIPYIEMHEFEALLFSDAEILAGRLGVHQSKIDAIVEAFSDPEEIDEGPETAPSKRLIQLDKDYRKVAMGTSIAQAIGVPAIRAKCRHFDAWLTALERLVRVWPR